MGKDTSGGDLRYIYSVGIKHHVLFGWERFDFTFGNALRHRGYSTRGSGPRDSFTSFDTGLDIRFPLGFNLQGKKALFSIYGVNYHFLEKTIAVDSEDIKIKVDMQWELGVTFSTNPVWKIWHFEIDRVGLGYRFGDGINAIRFVLGMPF